jgi:hypothetical protein
LAKLDESDESTLPSAKKEIPALTPTDTPPVTVQDEDFE